MVELILDVINRIYYLHLIENQFQRFQMNQNQELFFKYNLFYFNK